MTDYISELKSPTLQCHKDGSLPSPQETEAYFAEVERKKQEFLLFLTDKNQSAIKAYLDELIQAQKAIEKRGYYSMNDYAISSMITGGVEGSETLVVLKLLDTGLHNSIEGAIAFVKSLLGEEKNKEETRKEPTAKEEKEEIIRGVQGLADFLHIGKTKAQAIINSKILMGTKPPIQYSAGGWLFHKQRLQEYQDNHPTFVDDFKCPH